MSQLDLRQGFSRSESEKCCYSSWDLVNIKYQLQHSLPGERSVSFARHISSRDVSRFLIAALVAFSFETVFAADAVTKSDSKERSRLEEIFIWKASEELKLPPSDEAKFTEIIKSLNASRRQAGDEMDAAVKNLGEAKSKAEAEKALARHRAALKVVHGLQTAELDKLSPLLGPEKLARYLVVKTALLEKLKTMLSGPTAPKSEPAQNAAK